MNRRGLLKSGLGLAAGFARGAEGTRLNDPQLNVLIIIM